MLSVSVDTYEAPQVALSAAKDPRPVSLSDEEIGLIEDSLHQYRDSLVAFVERFDIGADETLPLVPGGVIATLFHLDALLMKLEAIEGV